jgi:tetratricopeptide (TPR) repeat protein
MAASDTAAIELAVTRTNGLNAMAAGDALTAQTAFAAALALDAGCLDEFALEKAELHRNAGNSFFAQHDYAAADRAYSSAVELAPAVADHWVNRSAVRAELHQHELSLADAEKAVSLNASLVKVRQVPSAIILRFRVLEPSYV